MKQVRSAVILTAAIIVISFVAIPLILHSSYAFKDGTSNTIFYSGARASIAVSGNHVYLTWWDNKTGNNEVFFVASNDNGKNFDKEINLSNAKGGSADSQIAAEGSNIYVTW